MIRVSLPAHLRKLAQSGEEVTVEIELPATQRKILDALERDYPVLQGTVREYGTKNRRPFLRFFAGGEDVSLSHADAELPREIGEGSEPFMIVGAIAGG